MHLRTFNNGHWVLLANVMAAVSPHDYCTAPLLSCETQAAVVESPQDSLHSLVDVS